MKDSIIERQIGLLHLILSNVAENHQDASGDFIKYTDKYFYFDTDFGWNLLLNAIYIFQDTELAKHDFNTFGFQGPCRHANDGEKYLRLYGVLNSVYQQYLAAVNLIELFKVESKQKYIQDLQGSDCIQLRNKIAAHSANYSEDMQSKQIFVYEISRDELEKGNVRLERNQDEYEHYDIELALKEFDKILQEILGKVLEKFIKKKFNNQGKFHEIYHEIEQDRNGVISLKIPRKS